MFDEAIKLDPNIAVYYSSKDKQYHKFILASHSIVY